VLAVQDLPEDVKAAHEHAASRYNVGWSHGKEALRSGLKDTHKGSFYANPMQVRVRLWGHSAMECVQKAQGSLCRQDVASHSVCEAGTGGSLCEVELLSSGAPKPAGVRHAVHSRCGTWHG
jgi:hypothetical protein